MKLNTNNEQQHIANKSYSWIFKVLGLMLPLVFLLLIEVLLRFFGYGHNTDLFIKYPDDTSKWVMNRYASEKFFSDTVNATKGSIEPFNINKTPGTLRIFVLGESTTAGYPYFHNGSFHRWLLYRLMHELPNQKIELINCSLTAVNSYTVLDFSKKIVNYQPDAVLVYVGHNEYYGALGVGSTSRIASNYELVQTVLKLRELRLVQLIDNLIFKVKTTFSGATDNRENLMKRMAAKQQIAYDEEDYKRGIHQFELNMDKMCALFQDHKVPVFLSTLVSNEKDLRPLISYPQNQKTSANLYFDKANQAYSQQHFTLAKTAYIQAKEYDLLRFRAPEAMNKIIKNLAAKYNEVHLVDTRSVFEQHAPHNILGKETLVDHVHPNLFGYALMSDAFYEAIKKAQLIKPNAEQKMSFAQLQQTMPVTKVDSLFGAYQIMMLKAGWPFNTPIPADFKRGNTIDEQLAGALAVGTITWQQSMDELFKQSMQANDKKTALKTAEAVLLESPDNNRYYIYAGRLNFELGNAREAVFYFKKAYQLDASFDNAQNLYLLFVKMDQPENALIYLNLALEKNASAVNLSNDKNLILDLIDQKNLMTKTADPNFKKNIAADYQRLNEPALAAKYFQH